MSIFFTVVNMVTCLARNRCLVSIERKKESKGERERRGERLRREVEKKGEGKK